MSALDELVTALQASLSSVQIAREHGAQATTAAQTAVEAAAEFGRERTVAETDALRADVEEAGAILATVETRLIELLQRAVALTSGTAGAAGATSRSAGARATPAAPVTAPRLSNADRAQIDDRKFTGYSMDPANRRNKGKWKAWAALGYDVENSRAAAATDVTRQLRAGLPGAEPYRRQETDYGPRCRTSTVVTGPNGRSGTLVCVWQYDSGSDRPRMVSNWLRVHEEETS